MILVVTLLLGSAQDVSPDDPTLTVYDETDLVAAASLLEELSSYRDHPLLLGQDDLTPLSQLPGISVQQIESLAEFARMYGAPQSKVELAAVELLGSVGVAHMLPFVAFPRNEPVSTRAGPVDSRRSRFTISLSFKRRLETRRGFDGGNDIEGFAGGPYAQRSRVEWRLNRHVTWRLATDHDAGEAFRLDPGQKSYGADFVTSGIEVVNIGPLRKLVFGDFTVRFGYGLTAWSGGRRTGIGVGVSDRPRLTGVSAKTGTSESDYLRGVGALVAIGEVGTLELFAARMGTDGSKDSGLHRTQRELDSRATSPGVLKGAAFTIAGPVVTLGFIGTHMKLSAPIETVQVAGGVVAVMKTPLAYVAFEANTRAASPTSWRLSASVRPSRSVEIATRIKRQVAPWPDALPPQVDGGVAGGSDPGWLTTASFRNGRWRIKAFRDYNVAARFTSTRWRPEVRVATGVDVRGFFNRVNARVVALRDTRDQPTFVTTNGKLVRGLESETTTRSKLQLGVQVTSGFSLRVTIARQESEHLRPGWSIGQEFRWRRSKTLNVSAGIVVFGTPLGEPIYAFESDVKLQYNWSRLDGSGSRVFGLIRLTPRRELDIQLKYGQTVYDQERELGSGFDYLRTDRLQTVTGSIVLRL
jgi:hypothetical protein